MYCLYWKHADEIARHASMVSFIWDYQDVIDNIGLETWWEDTPVVGREYGISLDGDTLEMQDLNVTVIERLESDSFDDQDQVDDPIYKVTAEFFVKASELRSSY